MSEQSTPAPSPEQVEYCDLAPLGYPGYRVGSDGSVWSCRPHRSWRDGRWRKLSPVQCGKKRYRSVQFWVNGKKTNLLVHRLVLEAFVGPRPLGMECCHEDDDPDNNRLGNLRWGTPKDNSADARRNGGFRVARGEQHPRAKLSEKDIPVVFRLRAEGWF